jgi:hypothetical protein
MPPGAGSHFLPDLIPVDNELYRHRPAHRLFCWCGNCFIIGICMQGIAIIIDRVKRLQSCPDIIEINFLSMQRTP